MAVRSMKDTKCLYCWREAEPEDDLCTECLLREEEETRELTADQTLGRFRDYD